MKDIMRVTVYAVDDQDNFIKAVPLRGKHKGKTKLLRIPPADRRTAACHDNPNCFCKITNVITFTSTRHPMWTQEPFSSYSALEAYVKKNILPLDFICQHEPNKNPESVEEWKQYLDGTLEGNVLEVFNKCPCCNKERQRKKYKLPQAPGGPV